MKMHKHKDTPVPLPHLPALNDMFYCFTHEVLLEAEHRHGPFDEGVFPLLQDDHLFSRAMNT